MLKFTHGQKFKSAGSRVSFVRNGLVEHCALVGKGEGEEKQNGERVEELHCEYVHKRR